MEIDLDFLEANHLIGRLKLIELLERQSPFRDLKESVERRFSLALSRIPSEHQEAALSIFGSTIYIPRQMLDDTWRFLWTAFQHSMKDLSAEPEQALVLELDRDQLRDDFYRANSMVGRLQDNLPWRSPSDIIDVLTHLDGLNETLRHELFVALSRPVWLLLIDITLSGTSALSELKRLRDIARILFRDGEPTKVASLIQVATEPALSQLRQADVDYWAAIVIPSSCALARAEYSSIGDASMVEAMKRACAWFAEEHVIPSRYRLAQMAKDQNDVNIARYGFGGDGWNIVTHKNSPNNCLPLLWFKPPTEKYNPPFERIDSRIGPSWPGRRESLESLLADEGAQERLRTKLREQS